MARTNIEEVAWNKIHSISNRLGWKKREVTGMLVDLWHNSQVDEVAICEKDKIVDYMELWNESEDEVDKVIKALVWQSLLRKKEDGLFEIVGNQKHIDKLKSFRERGKKGGRPKKDDGELEEPTGIPDKPNGIPEKATGSGNKPIGFSEEPNALEKKPNTIHYNSMQDNALQFNSPQANSNQSKASHASDVENSARLVSSYIKFDRIWEILSSGAESIEHVPPDLEMSIKERAWIMNNGGLTKLSRHTGEFEIKNLVKIHNDQVAKSIEQEKVALCQ